MNMHQLMRELNEPNESKIVLLVDSSASMRRQNLWPLALAKAEAVLTATSPADQVALFTFDQQAHWGRARRCHRGGGGGAGADARGVAGGGRTAHRDRRSG